MKLNRRISFWQLNPIARIALAYFIGLQSYKMIGFVNIEVTFCLCLFLLSFACIIFYTTEASQLKRLRCGNIILLFTICLIAGLSNSISHGRQVENTFPKELLGVNVQLRLKVQDELNFSKAGVVKFNATITHFKYQNQWYVSNSKVKCNSKFVDSISNLGPGAILHSIGQVNLPAYTEPNALFDYRNWLLDNKYSGTLSLNKEWMLISDGSNQLGGLSVRLRNSIFAFIRNSEYPESDKELAGALLLGDKVNLDPELKSSFSKSGIIHLLAVSGLHVGLVHQGISMILLLIFFGKPNLFFKSSITIILLWLYAFLTGLSPSVCRAATMLSLASIALAIKSHNQPFNTLFAAALILMIVDTDISSDIGFLLSFMAVFGILSSATLMKNLSSLGSQPIKFLLMSLLISSAAQWATLPITLFTFGKFPTYFLLANLLAIPLASFISFSGFLSLLFQSIPYVGELLLSLCMLSIELLNYISNLIADLPSSVLIIENLSISYFIVLLTVVISVLIIDKVKSSQLILLLLTGILCASSVDVWDSTTMNSSTNEIYVSRIKNELRLMYYSEGKLESEIFLPVGFVKYDKEAINFNLISDLKFGLFVLNRNFQFSKPPVRIPYIVYVAKADPDMLKRCIAQLRPHIILMNPFLNETDSKLVEDICKVNKVKIWDYKKCNRLIINT